MDMGKMRRARRAQKLRRSIDERSPGLRLAADIAQDQDMVCGFGGAAGTLVKLKMAVWESAGRG